MMNERLDDGGEGARDTYKPVQVTSLLVTA